MPLLPAARCTSYMVLPLPVLTMLSFTTGHNDQPYMHYTHTKTRISSGDLLYRYFWNLAYSRTWFDGRQYRQPFLFLRLILTFIKRRVSSFSVWTVRTRANRHSALHSNFPKQYAAASADPKKAAAQNHAGGLSSYLKHMAVTTALTRAQTLATPSHPK